MNILKFVITLSFLIISLNSNQATARSIYLNGVDISSAQSQDLEKVNIHINEKGDIFIIGPHYQVNEENTYTPLSRYNNKKKKLGKLAHKDPGQLGGTMLQNSEDKNKIPAITPPLQEVSTPTTKAGSKAISH